MVIGKAAQELQVRLAPVDDVFVVVAIGDRGADRQEQHLPQRIGDAPRLAHIFDRCEMLQKQRQARLGKAPIVHENTPESDRSKKITAAQPAKARVNP